MYIYSQGFQKVLICYFWIFLQFSTIFQSFSHKRKIALHRGPYTSQKIDSNEEAPIDTIHMSHVFADQPFSFLEFMREVLHANEAEEHTEARSCRPEEAHWWRESGGGAAGDQRAPM